MYRVTTYKLAASKQIWMEYLWLRDCLAFEVDTLRPGDAYMYTLVSLVIWFRQWFITVWHQAITWSNAELPISGQLEP